MGKLGLCCSEHPNGSTVSRRAVLPSPLLCGGIPGGYDAVCWSSVVGLNGRAECP